MQVSAMVITAGVEISLVIATAFGSASSLGLMRRRRRRRPVASAKRRTN